MKTKICIKCSKRKPLEAYYKHAQMGDGFLNKCKECTKLDSKKTREKNPEYYKEYDRQRSNLPHRVKLREEVSKRWRADPILKKRTRDLKKKWVERNIIKRAAHMLTGNAIRDGRLTKKPCEVCGKVKVDAHHDDYEKPLDVRWLCRKHHADHHKKEREKLRNAYS